MKNSRKKMKKSTAAFLIIILTAGACAAGIYFVNKTSQSAAKTSIFYTVKEEIIENNIEVSGNIEAAQTQTLQAQGDGTVYAVNVHKGQFVKKGAVIIQLDNEEQLYNLANHDYQMEQKRITGAVRELEIMAQQRVMYVKKLEKRQVLASYDGIIADLDVSVGDYLEAKDEIGTLINRSYLLSEVEVAETDAPRLKVGQNVVLTFPAWSSGTVQGVVESYPSVARITSRGATVLDAVIRIDNPPAEILPQYSFTGKIEISAPQSVVIVERAAVGYKNRKPFVEVVQSGGTTVEKQVSVMPYDKTYVKILSGAEVGDVLKNQSRDVSGAAAQRNLLRQLGLPGAGVPPGGPPPSGSASGTGSSGRTSGSTGGAGGGFSGPPSGGGM